jgi:hypothetical protein
MKPTALLATGLLCLAPLAANAQAQESDPAQQEGQAYLQKIDAFYESIAGDWEWEIAILTADYEVQESFTARSTVSYDPNQHMASARTVLNADQGEVVFTGEVTFLSPDQLKLRIQRGEDMLVDTSDAPNKIAIMDNHATAYFNAGEFLTQPEMAYVAECPEMYQHVVVLGDTVHSHIDCVRDNQWLGAIISLGTRVQEGAPSEEPPSEDTPSDAPPSEDVPSEDVPSEEPPSEDVPSENTPSAP